MEFQIRYLHDLLMKLFSFTLVVKAGRAATRCTIVTAGTADAAGARTLATGSVESLEVTKGGGKAGLSNEIRGASVLASSLHITAMT